MISATVGQFLPWLHTAWLVPVWFGWMLHAEQRNFRRILTVLLDDVPAQFKLHKIESVPAPIVQPRS